MSSDKYFIESLARGLEVLSLFTRERPSFSLSEIVEAGGLNKSRAFRIVSTLETIGYLERDDITRRYRPGLKVLNLGFTALTSLDVRQAARPYLERLSRQLGETVSIGVLEGLDQIYVDRIRANNILGIVLGLGSRLPAHCGSMGKVLLAHLPVEELAARLDGAPLGPCTPQTVTDHATLLAELTQVREQGYALNDEELVRGLRAAAAPLWGPSGEVVAAMNCSVQADDYSRDAIETHVVPAVIATAHQISQAMGYEG